MKKIVFLFLLSVSIINCTAQTKAVQKSNPSVNKEATDATTPQAPPNVNVDSNKKPAVNFVEIMPQFPGGEKAFLHFLEQNIKYPKKDKRKGVQGRVVLEFQVCTDGSLCNFEVKKSVSPTIDSEAIRIIQHSPQWKPGTINGVPVKTQYSLPILFSLTE